MSTECNVNVVKTRFALLDPYRLLGYAVVSLRKGTDFVIRKRGNFVARTVHEDAEINGTRFVKYEKVCPCELHEFRIDARVSRLLRDYSYKYEVEVRCGNAIRKLTSARLCSLVSLPSQRDQLEKLLRSSFGDDDAEKLRVVWEKVGNSYLYPKYGAQGASIYDYVAEGKITEEIAEKMFRTYSAEDISKGDSRSLYVLRQLYTHTLDQKRLMPITAGQFIEAKDIREQLAALADDRVRLPDDIDDQIEAEKQRVKDITHQLLGKYRLVVPALESIAQRDVDDFNRAVDAFVADD